jgi:transketolase
MTDRLNSRPMLAAPELERMARQLRRDVVEMIFNAGSGHAGGSLSAAEIVATLYWHVLDVDPAHPEWLRRDRFIASKGHCAPVVYAALARRGYFDPGELRTLRRIDSILQGHPSMSHTPGLDMSSGSLGQGLSVGLGMALGAGQRGLASRVFVLLGDGEMQEGLVWEAAMAAAHLRAGNLTAIVDRNGLQVDGPVSDVMNVNPVADKWRAFGWRVIEVDGHDTSALLRAFDDRFGSGDSSQPWVLIAHTVKGKGVSFMENVMEWHGNPISREQYEIAIRELDDRTGSEYPWQ